MKFYKVTATSMLTHNCENWTTNKSDLKKKKIKAAEIKSLRSIAEVTFPDLNEVEMFVPNYTCILYMADKIEQHKENWYNNIKVEVDSLREVLLNYKTKGRRDRDR